LICDWVFRKRTFSSDETTHSSLIHLTANNNTTTVFPANRTGDHECLLPAETTSCDSRPSIINEPANKQQEREYLHAPQPTHIHPHHTVSSAELHDHPRLPSAQRRPALLLCRLGLVRWQARPHVSPSNGQRPRHHPRPRRRQNLDDYLGPQLEL